MTLNGIVKEEHGIRSGNYKKASGKINNRFHWSQINGNQSIWYNTNVNTWVIGNSKNIGINRSQPGIWTTREEECPTIKNRFYYGNWQLALIDSISIECI